MSKKKENDCGLRSGVIPTGIQSPNCKVNNDGSLIDSQSMEEIHTAAMQSSLNEVSELISRCAEKLTHVENVRIRLVDYTGTRLVPISIIGLYQINDVMAVRSFQYGIIGRVARNLKTERVEKMQEDPDFKIFLECIEKRSKSLSEPADVRKKWKNYAASLRKLTSAIVVPITVAKIPENGKERESGKTGDKELIGIINVNSVKTPLTEKHKTVLNDFGSKLSVTFLNRRSYLVQKLHKIEKEMVSSCSWEEVAQHIVDGVQDILPDSMPNIYLFDENKEDNPFTFLAAPDTTKEVLDLGKHKPRWVEHSIGGLGQLAISKREFVVIEDVQNNSAAYEVCAPCDESGEFCRPVDELRITASNRAKQNGVTTIGCLPLVFHGRVVGILYLHFKEKIHFFTIEETKILNMFAFSAAIAIKNLSTSPSFKSLSGENLISYFKEYKSENRNPTLNLVIDEINKMTEELENSQGTNEIVQIINKGIRTIGKRLNMPEGLFKINSRFQRYEELLLFNIPNYRDHFVHTFFVFSIGILIIDKWIENKIPINSIKDDSNIEKFVKSWFICSIMHDVAYPVSQVRKWVPQFPKETLGLPCDFNATFDWTPFLLSSEIHTYIDKISNRFGEIYDIDYERKKNQDAFILWLHSQLLTINDHGVLGALAVMSIEKPDDLNEIEIDAALAIALHNYVKNVNKFIRQIEIDALPLAFLLSYCDVVQEWGRPTGNVTADAQLQEIMKRISFKELSVDQYTTKIVLHYDPKKNFGKKLDEIDVKSIITENIKRNIETYPEGWCKTDLTHTFKLAVNYANEKRPFYSRPIA